MTERNAIRVSVNANDEVLRRQGIVRRIVNESGECSRRPTRGDWLEELLLSSSLVQNEFNLVLESLRNGDVVQPREIVPGIWILAASTSCNRRNNRDSIAVLATRELASGEHLNLLCQAGRLDRTVVTSMLSKRPIQLRCKNKNSRDNYQVDRDEHSTQWNERNQTWKCRTR